MSCHAWSNTPSLSLLLPSPTLLVMSVASIYLSHTTSQIVSLKARPIMKNMANAVSDITFCYYASRALECQYSPPYTEIPSFFTFHYLNDFMCHLLSFLSYLSGTLSNFTLLLKMSASIPLIVFGFLCVSTPISPVWGRWTKTVQNLSRKDQFLLRGKGKLCLGIPPRNNLIHAVSLSWEGPIKLGLI